MRMGRFPNYLFGLVLALGVMMLPAMAEENTYIAVLGSGRAEQWPDYAEVTATVEIVEKTTKDAVSATTGKLLALARKLKDMDIPDDRIEFLSPTVQREKDHVKQESGGWKEITLGFESSQSLKVTVTDINKTGTVITVLTNEGAQIRSGVVFKVKDPNDVRARARADAIADARQKALDYAKGSNRRLGRLLIVEESQIGRYRLFPELQERNAKGTGSSEDYYAMSAPPVPLTPQPVSTSVTLYAKFALQ